jgi:hypothetical protein
MTQSAMVSPKVFAGLVRIPHVEWGSGGHSCFLTAWTNLTCGYQATFGLKPVASAQCVDSPEKLAQQGRAFLLFNNSIPDQQADELVQNLPQFHNFR